MPTPRFRLLLPVLLAILACGCSSGDTANGKARAVTCVACHGSNGMATLPISPDLSGMNEKYLAKQLRDFRDGSRSNPVMSPLAASLSDEQIDDLAAYFASLPRCSGPCTRPNVD